MKPHVLFCTNRIRDQQEARIFDVLVQQLGGSFEATCVVNALAGDANEGGFAQVNLAESESECDALFDKVSPALVVFCDDDLQSTLAARRRAQERGISYIVYLRNSPLETISKLPQLTGACSRQYRGAAAVIASSPQILSEVRTYLGVSANICSIAPSAEALNTRLLALIATKFPATNATAITESDLETIVSPAAAQGDTMVLITTANRPEMLRTALAGIQNQSARGRIREVLVSENTRDVRSLQICREFAHALPIRHVQRRPARTPLLHGKTVFGVAYDTAFVAILHDDDWWLPEHLEKSLCALERDQTVAAYSSFFEVADERSLMKSDNNVMMAFAAGFPVLSESWFLDTEAAFLSCLPGTPGRYSTLVARSSAMRKAAYIFDLENHFDNDRMLTVALAKEGPLSFLPFPSACIRMHANQDGRQLATPALIQRVTQTTAWLIQQAAATKVDLLGVLQKRIDACPATSLDAAVTCCSQLWVRLLLKDHPRLPPLLKEIWSRLERAPARVA